MNFYAEEVKGLKEKIRELQKNQQHEEKTAKKQQEYLVMLEQKYREVCEKAGVSASLNVSRAEENNRSRQLQKLLGQPGHFLQQQSPQGTNKATIYRRGGSRQPKQRLDGSVEEEEGDDEKLEV